ncbi:oligopeptide/dipeptide ABC transporter ATP-binding protein [Rhodobium orientis]|uniref:Peptide ABC transporter substrate-binding protein n=1 Tax=Rhodobium orientis TaxID=34017 RepID=A0A327JWU7_9HYPH|nr:oligopeptide/dipeptide ABC transporter ATP-binding protein [Rhodobium orientis]MBB4301426.1 oligopeptide/dipeptide ABC transporter ATP-binding protein [Rhodobium orientis]MBK5950986.1 peptide ABC transporter substrate-binding protein [Rhodobium orientis]RAI27648.1 peptide ABC transporter substrate-binding protein [Rhodobium orientis]
MSQTPPVLDVRDLSKTFAIRRSFFGRGGGAVHAVDGISFAIAEGETLGLVGESGCGKSTAGRAILRLTEPTAGEVWLDGERIDGLGAGEMRLKRRDIQVVFQDPYSSLNPRLRARDIVAEPLRNFASAIPGGIEERVADLFDRVGLRPDQMDRFPHEFSGGQRQRLVIARALALKPRVIICDEAVSALDVSVQAQVINLLARLQRETGVAFLFISHDLAVVEHVSHRVAVMYLGRIVEIADKAALYGQPRHPYTQALLSAAPVPDPDGRRDRTILKGEVPSPINRPSGCHFRTRCPSAAAECAKVSPVLRDVGGNHHVACHLVEG